MGTYLGAVPLVEFLELTLKIYVPLLDFALPAPPPPLLFLSISNLSTRQSSPPYQTYTSGKYKSYNIVGNTHASGFRCAVNSLLEGPSRKKHVPLQYGFSPSSISIDFRRYSKQSSSIVPLSPPRYLSLDNQKRISCIYTQVALP